MCGTIPCDIVGHIVIQTDLSYDEINILQDKEEKAKYVKLELFKTFLKEYNRQNTYTSKANLIDEWLTIDFIASAELDDTIEIKH